MVLFLLQMKFFSRVAAFGVRRLDAAFLQVTSRNFFCCKPKRCQASAFQRTFGSKQPAYEEEIIGLENERMGRSTRLGKV